MNYRTISSDFTYEEIIKKSRFICYLKRVTTEEEARDYIAQLKKEHYKANHSCSAMIIGKDSLLKRSSDDGEPSGTAGVPMLTVLEKQNLTNLVVVVTRYFGGIKLGAGGLIRAYSGTVANALRQAGIIEVKKLTGLQITLTYPQYQTFANFLREENLTEQDTQFQENITTILYLEKEKIDQTTQKLIDFYNGTISFQKTDPKIVEIPI